MYICQQKLPFIYEWTKKQVSNSEIHFMHMLYLFKQEYNYDSSWILIYTVEILYLHFVMWLIIMTWAVLLTNYLWENVVWVIWLVTFQQIIGYISTNHSSIYSSVCLSVLSSIHLSAIYLNSSVVSYLSMCVDPFIHCSLYKQSSIHFVLHNLLFSNFKYAYNYF